MMLNTLISVIIFILLFFLYRITYKQRQRIKDLEDIKVYYEKVLEHQRGISNIEEFTEWFFNSKRGENDNT